MNWSSDKITFDLKAGMISIDGSDNEQNIPINSPEGFKIASDVYLRAGWDTKYVYTFSWLGRPIIQLPDDMLRMQEVIYSHQPDIIIETGVAHGGSLIFYASLCGLIGKGRVVGIDIDIRPHNRSAIEAHQFSDMITLIEGSSVDEMIIDKVKSEIKQGEKVLVILDSNHTKEHVLAELEGYGPMVSKDSYIVATDGIMKDLEGAPHSSPGWSDDNPYAASQQFLKTHPEFKFELPNWPFNESIDLGDENVTYWPGAWLKRVE